MNWFDYYNPKPCIIISIAYLNQCFIYDKGSYYSSLLFVWKNILWIEFLLYPIPYHGNIHSSSCPQMGSNAFDVLPRKTQFKEIQVQCISDKERSILLCSNKQRTLHYYIKLIKL